ncbi:MAG: prenyltransferase/squalene oxidase repeat-containing protein [Candidatus Auribacterota bacterium]|jgi:hypothetical protein|nr:prenyltransferase/squalene oxidase repeat-containing protein [Candidatus Auribacterota bacterium]
MMHTNLLRFSLVILFISVQPVISYGDTKSDIVSWLASTQNDDGSWNSYYPEPEFDTVSETTISLRNSDEGTIDTSSLCTLENVYSMKLACQFTVSETYTCKKIVLPLRLTGTGTAPIGKIWVRICSDYNGSPGNTIASSLWMDADSLAESNIEFDFILPDSEICLLEEGSTYHIVLEGSKTMLQGESKVTWSHRIKDEGESPTEKCYYASSIWFSWNGNRRLLYKIYGYNKYATFDCLTKKSTLATLATTKALLLDRGSLVNFPAIMPKALSWVENQEFFNTEYLSRQIEILSLAGKNCSMYIDKLSSLRNKDGGWGEYSGYKSNPLDTIWALRALLSFGYRDELVMQQALELIISCTSKVNTTNSDEYFRWSTFYPTYCPADTSDNWKLRVDSSIVSAYFLDLIYKYHDDYEIFDNLALTNKNLGGSTSGFSAIRNGLETFLYAKLVNWYEQAYLHEALIIATVFQQWKSLETIPGIHYHDIIVEFIPSLLKSDGNSKHYNQDPYLTSLILETLTATDHQEIDISFESNFNVSLGNEIFVSTVNFYIKKSGEQDYNLLPYSWTPHLTNLVSFTIPTNVQPGDIIAVSVNNTHWDEKIYTSSTRDMVIYAKDITLYELDDQNDVVKKIENYTFQKTTQPTKVRAVQKIVNTCPRVSYISVGYYINNTLQKYDFISDIPPANYILTYSADIDLPTNVVGTITLRVTITGSGINGSSSATVNLHVISGDGTANANLAAPLFPKADIITRDKVLISWQAPLDPNVVAYKVIRGTTLEGVTTSTFLLCNLYDQTTYYIYSIDKDNHSGLQHAEITVTPNPPEPVITVTYPQDNQIIILLEDNDTYSNSVLQFDVKGTIKNYSGDNAISIKITTRGNENDTIVNVNGNDLYLFPEEGIIYRFCINNPGSEDLTTGDYDLVIKASTAYPEAVTVTEVIPIKIQKWVKASFVGDNNSSHPSWNIIGSKIMFTSDELFDSSGTQNYFQQIWQITNFMYFVGLVAEYQQTTTFDIVPLTSGMTNHLEPSWISQQELMYVAYSNGNRTIVLRNAFTSGNTVLDIAIDSDGNQVPSESLDPLIHSKKSFYNPSCRVFESYTTRFIVASDEFGELVLVVKDENGAVLHNLTHNMTDNPDKQFILGDHPDINIDHQANRVRILFEGYSMEHPSDYSEGTYINSDIYLLQFDVPVNESIVNLELRKLTDTPSESELSPVWFCDGQTDDFLDANIAFVKYNDFRGEGIEESTIYVGNLTALDTASPKLINSYPIAPQGSFKGLVQNIDVNNYYFLYDELLYDGETADSSYRSHIGYVKLDSDIHGSFIIAEDPSGTNKISEEITIETATDTNIYVRIATGVTLESAIFDNDINDSIAPVNFDVEKINQLNFTSITTWTLFYPLAGTYTAEFVFKLNNGLRFNKKFTVIVNE